MKNLFPHVKPKIKAKGSKKSKNLAADQKGQLAIEGVLIVILLLSLSVFATKYIRDNGLMSKMISGPWKQIAGMMGTGNWMSHDDAISGRKHPHLNTMTRVGD